jgi:CBS domain-containing protein
MHFPVITVPPTASVAAAARLMLDRGVSGLPVVDADGKLRGIVTEGDFLRRTELDTEVRRPRWLEFFFDTGRIAEEYTRAHSRRVADIMQAEPFTCRPDDPLESIVETMGRRHIKRLPVVENGRVVGIIARADLLRALAPLVNPGEPETISDAEIALAIERRMKAETWPSSLIETTVKGGVVTLKGTVFDRRQQEAMHVLVENVPGVKQVVDDLVWIEPFSATVVGPLGGTA